MTAADIITAILQREGAAYTDLGADKGGPTRYGITLASLQAYRQRPVTADDVRLLTEAEARACYADRYIRRPHFDGIADGDLQAEVVDAGVQHGQPTAAMMLQRAAHVADDGTIGPATLAAVNASSPKRLRLLVLGQRFRLEGHLITRDHAQACFAEGWANRLVDLLDDVAADL